MTFKSGKGGRVTVNGTELPILNWSVNPASDVQRFRNSRTGDYTLKEATFKDASFDIEIDYDFDANPFASPLSITIGTSLSNVRLYLNGTSGPYWSFPDSVVVSTPQSVQVEGRIATRVVCEANGTFSPPA